ncbi:hypothetical protein ABTM71_19285, partial [Acinetobacter baumannii]
VAAVRRPRQSKGVMRRTPPFSADRLVLPVLAALVLLLSPAVRLWASPDRPWWLLFVLWTGLIALIAWAGWRDGGSDEDRR